MGNSSFMLHFVANGMLSLSVSSYATKTLHLIYFTANQAPYLNADSGGATGTYSWVSSGGYGGGGTLKIQYSFPNSAGYSVWREIPSPALSTSVTGLSFMVQDASGSQCYVRSWRSRPTTSFISLSMAPRGRTYKSNCKEATHSIITVAPTMG